MVWYGMVNVNLYSAIITKVCNALNTLVSGEKPGFQALSKGLIVLLCTEVVRQGVQDQEFQFCSCSLAVLDPRVGHTMDVLSPFIPVLCHSD